MKKTIKRKKLTDRLKELREALGARQQRLRQLQNAIQNERDAIMSTNGGIIEIESLLKGDEKNADKKGNGNNPDKSDRRSRKNN